MVSFYGSQLLNAQKQLMNMKVVYSL